MSTVPRSDHWLHHAPHLPDLHIATDPAARAAAQQALRATARQLLGDFPSRPTPLTHHVVAYEAHDGYRVERFTFDDGVGNRVPGVCYLPLGNGPFPAVLWCHWHGGDYHLGIQAVDESGITPVAPGPTLARLGHVVLAIDAPGFGARNGLGPDGTRDGVGESSMAKYQLLCGRTMWGLTVHDDLCALDLLAARPEVDATRIATAGISMGCLRALWAAALDERLKLTIGICCLVRMQDLIAAGDLKRHGHYYYVPGMLRHFDIEGLLSCIAPRALLSLNGELDALVPLPGIHSAERLARPAWELAGAGDRLRVAVEPGVGHAWTPAMWQEMHVWLERRL